MMPQPQTPLLDSLLAAMDGLPEAGRGRAMLAALADADSLPHAAPAGGTVSDRLRAALSRLDGALSKQLVAVMHHPAFQTLEGSWRGLAHLVFRTETDDSLKIKLLQACKEELADDFAAAAPEQSVLHRLLFTAPFEEPNGEPFAAVAADFAFTRDPADVALLAKCAAVGAAAFCPILAAAAPELFGWPNFDELTKAPDLQGIFQDPAYDDWRAFRESESAAYAVLVCPRVLARPPYGAESNPIVEFRFEELDAARTGLGAPLEAYTWTSCAYLLAANIARAFDETGWCTAVRGAENGGKVEGLPRRLVESEDGAGFAVCPTEVQVGARRVAELARLGFLALRHYKSDEHAVFFGGQTCRKPAAGVSPEGTADAALMARLPYVLATGRIAQYVKTIARDVFRGRAEPAECEVWLRKWLARCVTVDLNAADGRLLRPLASGSVKASEAADHPGMQRVVLHLRPWLTPDELSAEGRLTVLLPGRSRGGARDASEA